jgi:hypothetical protein
MAQCTGGGRIFNFGAAYPTLQHIRFHGNGEKAFKPKLFRGTLAIAMELAYGSTADGDRRTAGQSERDDQEQNKDRTRSHGDSLEKTKKEQAQSHWGIVQLSRSLSEITMVILTIMR